MRATGRIAAVALFAAAATGCRAGSLAVGTPVAKWVLEAPERVEILAIEEAQGDPSPQEKRATFRGVRVNGRASIDAPEEQKKVLALVSEGLHRYDGVMAKCFNPHHAVSITRGGKTVDLVICYECKQIEVYSPDAAAPTREGTSAAVAPGMDEVFRAHGLHAATEPR